MGHAWDAPTIARKAKQDAEGRETLGPHSASRPGRTEPRSSSAFGNAAGYAGPVSAGAEWQMWCEGWAREALRVLKPGGHLVAAGGSRTFHRLVCALEDAGFEIRDCITHHYAQGFPKSHNVSKAIDKAAGAEREITGSRDWSSPATKPATRHYDGEDRREGEPLLHDTAPATPEAARWDGWGTALKPATEFWTLARKPPQGNIAENVVEHGTGALNIDGTRIAMSDTDREVIDNMGGYGTPEGFTPNDVYGEYGPVQSAAHEGGRWPANLALSHHPDCKEVGTRKVPTGTAVNRNHEPGSEKPGTVGPVGLRNQTEDRSYADADGTETVPAYDCVPGCPVAALDEQSGESTSKSGGTTTNALGRMNDDGWVAQALPRTGHDDEGGASRFFFTSKASREERNAGLDAFEDRPGPSEDYGTKAQHPMKPEGEPNLVLPTKNHHPTVKGIDLMRWLVKMVTPPGGTVLDPFTGSGSTGCAAVLDGFSFLGIEREPDYVEIARARIAFWAEQQADDVPTILAGERRAREHRERGQLTLG